MFEGSARNAASRMGAVEPVVNPAAAVAATNRTYVKARAPVAAAAGSGSSPSDHAPVMSSRARTRHTYDRTRRGGRMT